VTGYLMAAAYVGLKEAVMSFKPKFLATGIGSMPFADVEHAVDVSLSTLGEAPFWPQLPKLDLNEQMEIQYSEGMPCIVIDREKGRMYFDTSVDYSEAFAEFYEAYMMAMDPDEGSGDCSAAAIGPEFSRGIYAMEKRLQALGKKLPFVKVQTTGPCSFALSIVDENKRAIYYNEEFRDVVVKALAMKCRWQIQKFKPFGENVICFIDEPVLSGFGSSTYISVHREDVVAYLQELIEAVHADNGIAGVHCCGNTEWSILIDAGVDIVNFDAFGYGETIAMYPEAVKTHLERGGMLAWGVVPTSTAIREQTADTMVAHFEKMMDNLASRGIDKQLIVEQAIVTPSCGAGSMESEDAEKVFEINNLLSKAMREKYGF
jgi:methionine synthase II (cobalamin-independent)